MSQIISVDAGRICGGTWIGTELGEKSKASTPLQVAPWVCSLSSTAMPAWLQHRTGNRKPDQTNINTDGLWRRHGMYFSLI